MLRFWGFTFYGIWRTLSGLGDLENNGPREHLQNLINDIKTVTEAE